ncbi:unnamed protein product [Rhizoctonia solani]|uniref:Protein kinase domain-containing protein n=1 Tax=Rhizoctonia solani TaxID=456999 RepID=A0A8H3DM97_9AGAM|nr:unnamed protein product [Rhizoctonia solani]
MDPSAAVWPISWMANLFHCSFGFIHFKLALKSRELFGTGAKYTLASDIFALGIRPGRVRKVNDAGNFIWDILCKCWSFNPENRPSAKHVGDVMSMIFLTARDLLDGVTLKSRRLVVREGTTVQDLIPHFEKRGLASFTELLHSANLILTTSIADTALANVDRVELTSRQSIAVKWVKHNTPYKRLKRAARELDCWSFYRHPNILPVLGFAIFGADLAMVSPWMSNGCHGLCDETPILRPSFCLQLAQAIAYLHENNVVHGDIKGPNVLVSDVGAVQVTDFGVSVADHQEIEFSSTSSGRGTQRWQAS